MQQLRNSLRKNGHQVHVQVFPESKGFFVKDFSLFVLLVLLLHYVVLVLDVASYLFLLIELQSRQLLLVGLLSQAVRNHSLLISFLHAYRFDQ